MAVLARKRTLSQMQFYMTAIDLRKSITFILLRDLGVKNKVRTLKFIEKGMAPEDAKTLNNITDKYGMNSLINEYPEWFIDKIRNSIWDILRDMMLNITWAYSIWATCKAEAEARRVYQDKAIADCESLIKELELALDILPVNSEKYMPYVDKILKEEALLKGWRKSDNKRYKELN